MSKAAAVLRFPLDGSFLEASVTPVGERVCYALLGVLVLATFVPIGPVNKVWEPGAVARPCHATSDQRWTVTSCHGDERVAHIGAYAALDLEGLPR